MAKQINIKIKNGKYTCNGKEISKDKVEKILRQEDIEIKIESDTTRVFDFLMGDYHVDYAMSVNVKASNDELARGVADACVGEIMEQFKEVKISLSSGDVYSGKDV